MVKKCAICHSVNDPGNVYCSKCGNFLYANAPGAADARKIRSIWEMDRQEPDPAGQLPGKSKAGSDVRQVQNHTGAPVSGALPSMWVYVCPACRTKMSVPRGERPLFCSVCNYIFQEKDKPLSAENAAVPAQNQRAPAKPERRGPMKRAREDRSLFRLVCLTGQKGAALDIRPEGTVLGSAGNMRKDLFLAAGLAPRQAEIQRTPAGWYIRVLGGENYLNGDAMMAGVFRTLADGDFIRMGTIVFRVKTGRDVKELSEACRSSLRLVGISGQAGFVCEVSPLGSILGSAGTLEPGIFRAGSFQKVEPRHLEVFFSRGEWKLRGLGRMTLLNGAELNQGFARSIHNGDLINAGDCIMRAEIV